MRTLISILTLIAIIGLMYRVGELEGMLVNHSKLMAEGMNKHHKMMIVGMRCVGSSIDEFEGR